MAVSSVISFRASGDFLDWLQSQAFSGESPSQAAQRLLRTAFDSGEDVSPSVNAVDTVDTLSPGLDLIFDRLDKVEARLSQLEPSFEPVPVPIAIPDSPHKQLTIYDALAGVEISLKSSGLLGLTIEEEQNQLLREDFDKLQAEYDALLESSSHIISKLRAEVSNLRSKFEAQERDRDELEEKLNQAEIELMDVHLDLKLPDSADVLNALKARRKSSRVTIPDIEAIFKLL